jgi:hypothetical protein
MIHTIALTMFLGQPLILYGGIFTFLCIITTATIGLLHFKGVITIPFKWHPRFAVFTITVAIFHAILGLSIFWGF